MKIDPKISAPKIAASTSNTLGRSVSAETVRRVLRKAGYNGRVARKKPLIAYASSFVNVWQFCTNISGAAAGGVYVTDDIVRARFPTKDEKKPNELYLQVDDHVHPGNCPAAVSIEKKKQDLLHMEFYHHLPSWAMNEQMYFSSFSDEWSRDLKSVQVQKQRSCRELSRNANQSATQNNGQTSRVKSLDEIVKMVRLLTVKVPNKSDGWDYFFSSLEKAFASEMVSDELKPKVLLCMLGDKVSNLLVNLGEEELKDYESLKQVVLKEYEPSPQKYV
ncbi:retrovirus-related Pol polyprotein from transposon opus [Trichonephila clavipes]|uniref:Retrovirus-related Pol polyprotein from transposon opus n=1 Tax=Trichonephila clavipes TaxID=2585209 RepID=A0A8X6SM39_TRICX|nr:retrovirus-related Pol polyprotein from transposon opus [Trichonephila clavipes]